MKRRKYTLLPSIVTVLESLGVKAWVHEGRVAHDGDDALREEIGQAIERVRVTGVRRTALLYGAVLTVALDRGSFSPADIQKLDALGVGNADYILTRLEELEND